MFKDFPEKLCRNLDLSSPYAARTILSVFTFGKLMQEPVRRFLLHENINLVVVFQLSQEKQHVSNCRGKMKETNDKGMLFQPYPYNGIHGYWFKKLILPNQPSENNQSLLPEKIGFEICKTFKETILAQPLFTLASILLESHVPQNEVVFKGQNTALNSCEIFPIVAEGQLL